MKRTWYFLRRNSLAMVGLAIIVIIAGMAVFATFIPAGQVSWVQMTDLCSANYGPDNAATGWYNSTTMANGPFTPEEVCSPYVCTYEVTPPPNAAQFCSGDWYKIPYSSSGAAFPSLIAPTVNFATFRGGPLPLGSITLEADSATSFFNLWLGLLRGSDWSLIISVSIVGIGATIGLFAGVVAGFYGGVVDDVIMRLTDIFLSIPIILFIIVLITVLSISIHEVRIPGFALLGWHWAGVTVVDLLWTPLFTAILGFAIVWWPLYARLVRSQVLTVREQKYVEAARASGASGRRILFHHIIPNSLYPLFIQFSLDVGTVPLLFGSLVFLGFSSALLPTPYFPEWGNLAALSVVDLETTVTNCMISGGLCVVPWWQLFFPGLAVFMLAVSVNLLSDGFRDALDPRLRR